MIRSSSAMSSSSRVMVTRCMAMPGLLVRRGGHGLAYHIRRGSRTWLCQWPRAQGRQIEPVDLPQQFDESLGAVFQRGLAFGRGCLAGIADGAGGMQILRHPAEACRLGSVQPVEIPLQRDGDRFGV